MMMLIHRICMAFRGLGKFISVAKEMSVSAAMLLTTSRGHREGGVRGRRDNLPHSGGGALTHVLSWKRTKFLMLL